MRLIDADAFDKTLEKLSRELWNQKFAPPNWAYAYEEVRFILNSKPTIDPCKECQWTFESL